MVFRLGCWRFGMNATPLHGQVISTVRRDGLGLSDNERTGAEAHLWGLPKVVATDAQGNVYAAGFLNQRGVRISPNWGLLTVRSWE